MPIGTTIAIVSVSAVLLTGGGFLAGRATAPDSTAEVLEAQAQQLDTILDGQTEILTAASSSDGHRRRAPRQARRDSARVHRRPARARVQPPKRAGSTGRARQTVRRCGLIRDAYIARQACAEE